MKLSGYSGTPLAKKLGIKENFRIKIINAPKYYFDLFSDLPPNLKIINGTKSKKDFIHCFLPNSAELYKNIQSIKKELEPNGMLWISWYKKSSKIPTDLSEDIIRNTALKNGLVDIKVCAVDELWSALKLVIPLKKRSGSR